MEAVLSQVQDGREVVVTYYNKALLAPEKKYCTTRRELLAVVKAVKHFRPYLYGRTFRLRLDHVCLIWLCRRAEPSSQVAHWLEILAEFSYRIEHRPGKKHGNVDGLSRRRTDGCKQCQNLKRRDGGPLAQTLKNRWRKQVYTTGKKENFGLKPLVKLLTTFMQTQRCSGMSRSCVGSRIRYQG